MKTEISTKQFVVKANDIWDTGWFLLTSGDFQKKRFNSMTVSWGGFGTMWNLPIAMVVVRPSRYTFEFINQYDNFTLCAFSKEYRKALNLLGAKSGRDGDKIAESRLTPCAAAHVSSPIFNEAELVVECRKLYWQDFDPSHFLDQKIFENYPEPNYHRMFYGEILSVMGNLEKYCSSEHI
jgi:flavin reductase (DIM6/NTAB) family NADH-FMN oxidoreductase RutF